MKTDEEMRRLAWLWRWPKTPICPLCGSVYTWAYIKQQYGYGCIDCGQDFGRVLSMR